MVRLSHTMHHCYCSRARLLFLFLRICFCAGVCAVLFWSIFEFSVPWPLAVILALFMCVLCAHTITRLAYSRFCISDTELSVSCGVFFTLTDHVPFSSILRVRMHRGVCDQVCGTAHVHIYPKKELFDESSFSYACLNNHGSYVCVLPIAHAHHLLEILRARVPHMLQ